MKINVVTNNPEATRQILAEIFSECTVEILQNYGNTCDFEVKPKQEGNCACSLEGLEELLWKFDPWDIRVY